MGDDEAEGVKDDDDGDADSEADVVNEGDNEMDEGDAEEENEEEVEVETPPTSCSKCSKATLSKVAVLAKRLTEEKALLCYCCGLAVPAYCFTKQQLEVKEPNCRGCRGVPTIVATLTKRTEKLLADFMAGKPKPQPRAKPLKCSVCKLIITELLPGHLRLKEKLACSCCDRELPVNGTFYSNNQRHKGSLRRCKGCLGQVGKSDKGDGVKREAGSKAWRKKLGSAYEEAQKEK